MASLNLPSNWRMPDLFHRKETSSKSVYGALSLKEEIRCLLEGIAVAALFAYFFYRSLLAFFLLLPGVYRYRSFRKQGILRQKQEKLQLQFKELLLAVNTNMQAGYSIENAFLNSRRDMLQLFGSDSEIVKELEILKKGMGNGIPLSRLLKDLGERSGEGEIREFAEVFVTAGETGGRWNDIMKKTVDMIQLRMEIKEEIAVLIHAKKTESRIMSVIPFFILFYMDLTSQGYFDMLYHQPVGIVIMTACMCLYCTAFLMGEKITELSL